MFGIITGGFIRKVHEIFDELDYHVNEKLSYDDFQNKAVYSLNHSATLEDAKNVIKMFQYCLKEWNKIEKIFEKHLTEWSALQWEGSSLISYLDVPEGAEGSFYITNGINKKFDDITLTGASLDNNIYEFSKKGNKFYFDEESGDYIKYSSMSSTKMKLFNSEDQCMCNIVLSENLGIFLENNKTNYELFEYEDSIGIYDKKYMDSLKDDDFVDFNKCLGIIDWDILDEKSDLGVTYLSFFEDNIEPNILFLIAASVFLLFKRYMDSEKRKSNFFRAAMLSRISRR